MPQFFRRMLPLVLAMSGGAVALTATPAHADITVSCSPSLAEACLANNSGLSVYWGDGWCWGDNPDMDTETYGCGSKHVLSSQAATMNVDVDTVRYDANCVTTVNGLTYNRLGQGSHWHHFSPGILGTMLNVTEKQCFGPQGLYQTGFGSGRISIGWDAIVSDYDDPSDPITYGVYRNGTLIATLGRTHNYFDDTGLASSTTYLYSVSVRRTYSESDRSAIYASTSAPPPPQYPAETAPPYLPTVSYSHLYYVTTFGSAPGKVGSTTVGYLYASSSNYVFCKAEWGVTTGPYGHNKWWMYTDLDTGGRGWVSAYYLSNYGDDQVFANGGGEIPYC